MQAWSELFNLEDDSQIKKAIEILRLLLSVYDQAIDGAKALSNSYKKSIDEIVKSSKELEAQLNKLNPSTEENQENILKIAKAADVAEEQVEELNKETKELDKTVVNLTKNQEKFFNQQKKLTDQEKQLEKLRKRLNDLDSDRAEDIAKVRVQIQERNKRLKEEAKESLGLVSLYQKQSKRLNDLRNRYKDLALSQGENSKEAKNLQKEIEALDKRLKDIDSNVGQNQRRVGAYADALLEVGGSGAAAVDGVKAFGSSLRALLANPIVALLAATAAGLTLVFKAFQRTAVGAELFSKAGALIEGLFSAIVGLTDKAAKGIIAVFEDPLGSLQQFGEFLFQNIINRFAAIPKLLQIAGNSISQLINRDFEGLKESASEAGEAIIQLTSGLDPDQQESFSESIQELTNDIKETTNAFLELEKAQRRVRKENRELEKTVESLTTKEELLLTIRDDATRSFREREEAAQQAAIQREKRAAAEQKIAQNSLDLVNAEIEVRRRNGEQIQDLLDQQLEAQKAVIQANRETLLAQRENEKELDQLFQDRSERDLDFELDITDAVKARNERILADERLTFAERKKLSEENRRLADESFVRQEQILSELSEGQINITELINLDAQALRLRVRELEQSEIVEGRTIEVIKERITFLQDLEEAERDLAEEERKRNAEVIQREKDRNVRLQENLTERGARRLQALEARIQAELDAEDFRFQELLRNEKLTLDERIALEDEFQEKRSEIQEKGFKERVALIEREAKTAISFGNEVSNFLSALSARRTQANEEELDKLQKQREEDLERAGENLIAREAIQANFAKRQEQLQEEEARRARRLAIFNKALAVSESIIDTASAAAKALPNITAAIAVSVFGALKTAAIIAQPIPGFFKGTENAPGGPAYIGEKGRELVIEPSGRTYLSDNKKQLAYLPKGTKVKTNEVTEQILQNKSITHNNQSSQLIKEGAVAEKESIVNSQMSTILNASNDSLKDSFEEAVNKIPVTVWNVGRHGLRKDVRKGNTTYKNVRDRNKN